MSKRVICKFFANGGCLKGEECDFLHEWSAPPYAQPDNICKFYQKGTCNYGSRCKFEHVKVYRSRAPDQFPPVHRQGYPMKHYAGSSSHSSGAPGGPSRPPVGPAQRGSSGRCYESSSRVGLAVTFPPLDRQNYLLDINEEVERSRSVDHADPFHPSERKRYSVEHYAGNSSQSSVTIQAEATKNSVSSGPSRPPIGPVRKERSRRPDVLNAKDEVEYLRSVDPAERSLCSASGDCPRGNTCPYIHGDLCPTCGIHCLHPSRLKEREEHIIMCQKRQKHSEALRHSKDIECNVCLERVLSKPTPEERKFGILPECDHPFCISCIRNWRSNSPDSGLDVNSALRACPICRKLSYFVVPSVIWYSSQEEKQEIIQSYKDKLKSIDCKHFKFGNGTCPFGSSCFYKHTVKPGSLMWNSALSGDVYPHGSQNRVNPRRSRNRGRANVYRPRYQDSDEDESGSNDSDGFMQNLLMDAMLYPDLFGPEFQDMIDAELLFDSPDMHGLHVLHDHLYGPHDPTEIGDMFDDYDDDLDVMMSEFMTLSMLERAAMLDSSNEEDEDDGDAAEDDDYNGDDDDN